MLQTFNIYIDDNRVNVSQYGNGKRLLVVFHGYGDSAANYERLWQVLGNGYTVAIPDLPYHGSTCWHHGILTVDLLKELLRAIIARMNVVHCSILGYSMGGRLTICLGEYAADLVDNLILVAPEGLRRNGWFNMATGTSFGKWLFKSITFHPEWILTLIKTGKAAGLIHKQRAAYLKKLMENRQERLRIYHIWNCFGKLKPDISAGKLKKNNFFYKVPAHLLFGQYDKLIPPPKRREKRKWQPATISVIPAGHTLGFHEQTLKEIRHYISPLPEQ